jgi:hypothetical protein
MAEHQPEFNAYVDGAKRLLGEDVDRHVESTRIVYYGEMPTDLQTAARENYPAIEVPDDSGTAKYSVLISGDLPAAKTVLIKAMSWSDHPGRGFEALREALIADEKEHLAVVGVSFPGTFLASRHMTSKQRESLKKDDFSYIGAQQWEAINAALQSELSRYSSSPDDIHRRIKNYDFVLSGSSQGSVNAVGLFQSVPEFINVKALGLAQEVGLEAQGWWAFRKNFISHGGKNFKQYVSQNAYNNYPDLGPDFGSLSVPGRVLLRPASHLGSVIKGMRSGGDVQRILDTVRERDIQDMAITLATGTEDGVAHYEMTKRAEKALNVSSRIIAQVIGWEGHYHPAMENLANAQHVFRGFTK